MEYLERTGGYADAYADVLANGGQLHVGKTKDSANVVVRGRTCVTYYPKGSKKRQQVRDLQQFFHLEDRYQTGGRIARWMLKDLLEVPHEGTFWQRPYRELAKKGEHWHYSYVEPYKHFYGVEIDIKSAYISSLFAGKSLLYQSRIGWMDDNGALDLLKQLSPQLPKWFRLQLLGVLAGWRFSFLARDKSNPDSKELVYRTMSKIAYGAAFNATHRAILRNYKIMQRLHEIGQGYIRRMHTDSLFLDIDCPVEVEDAIFNYIADKGLTTSIKGAGHCFFWDLNTGHIGKRFVGSRADTIELMKENGIKMKRDGGLQIVLDRFGDKLKDYDERKETIDRSSDDIDIDKQLQIWDN